MNKSFTENNRKSDQKKQEIKDQALKEARAVAPKYCEKCGTKYTDQNFNLVKKEKAQAVFHLKCSNCGNTYMLNVVAPAPHMMASQRSSVNIDVNSPEELTKFAGKGSVTRDEVIDIYQKLKTDDIESLLQKSIGK
ncbi:hypothetical protein GF389_00985 [Candidatus Dojkabacteria bacterium]|nr:hypothetical protein [Candidatus Dojkabacteria bacterium]